MDEKDYSTGRIRETQRLTNDETEPLFDETDSGTGCAIETPQQSNEETDARTGRVR